MPEHGATGFSLADVRALADGPQRRQVHKAVLAWANTLPWEHKSMLLAHAKQRSGDSRFKSAFRIVALAGLATCGAVGLLLFVSVAIAITISTKPNFADGFSGVAACALCCGTPLVVVGSLVWASMRVGNERTVNGMLHNVCITCGYGFEGLGGAGVGITCPECGTRDERDTMSAWVLTYLRTEAAGTLAQRSWRRSSRATRLEVKRAWKPQDAHERDEYRALVYPAGISGALSFALAIVLLLAVQQAAVPMWIASITPSLALGYFAGWWIARRAFVRDAILKRISADSCPCCAAQERGLGDSCDTCGGPLVRVQETPESVLEERFGVPAAVFRLSDARAQEA
jgi:hypothetical protein